MVVGYVRGINGIRVGKGVIDGVTLAIVRGVGVNVEG
jgi:hypothetical protein